MVVNAFHSGRKEGLTQAGSQHLVVTERLLENVCTAPALFRSFSTNSSQSSKAQRLPSSKSPSRCCSQLQRSLEPSRITFLSSRSFQLGLSFFIIYFIFQSRSAAAAAAYIRARLFHYEHAITNRVTSVVDTRPPRSTTLTTLNLSRVNPKY